MFGRSFLFAAVATCCAFASPDPTDPIFSKQAPESYQAEFTTNVGTFIIEVTRNLAPIGADRFYGLVSSGFYDGNEFFRVVPNFVVQWGINGSPSVQSKWRDAHIQDDPNHMSNALGTVVFATSGTDSRTTQLFINFKDNSFLDSKGFAPFGKVVGDGLDTVKKINAEYGQSANQGRIQSEGNEYLKAEFPKMSSITSARILHGGSNEASMAPAPPTASAAIAGHHPLKPRNAMHDILHGK